MKKFLKSKRVSLLLVSFIILIAASFRLYGLNWDQNQHLHPDERFLTMVTQAVDWPSSISEYLNQQISPLNPYNSNFNFFVYGTFPLKIVKLASSVITIEDFDYNNIALVGRLISTLFDLATLIFVYLIAKTLLDNKTGLIAAFVYSISVLPIQLSHYYAVDTFLVFFLTASFYLLVLILLNKRVFFHSILLGISFGFALSSKISALTFSPIILAVFVFYLLKHKRVLKMVGAFLLFILIGYLSFRITDPRVFAKPNLLNLSLNPSFINNLEELKSFNNPESNFPPGVQWINTKPLIFPLKNLILWGLGLPLGIVVLLGLPLLLITFYKKVKSNILTPLKLIKRISEEDFLNLLIISWIFLLFIYQGVQYAKNMRYFYPIYPFLAIIAAYFIGQLITKINYFLVCVIFIILLLYPISFLSIYSNPHSRIAASKWIYKNIPIGSTISCEHWDDCLPLSFENQSGNIYKTELLTLFDPDTNQKWRQINSQLANIDYLILSSNRLWGSITKVAEKYPTTSEFYEDLFSNQLQFIKVAEFTSYPTLPILNINFPDDNADESFTVYDHPKVIIFKKDNKTSSLN